MAVIGSIVIGMSAQTDRLEKGLARAEKAVLKFGRSGKVDAAAGLAKIKAGSADVAAKLGGLAAGANRVSALGPGFRLAAGGALELTKGLAKLSVVPATKLVGGIARSLNGLPDVAAGAAKGLATAALAVGISLGTMAADAAEAIDRTGDAADRLGTTTARLSELRYAAKLTGSEAEALDAGLSKLTLKLGEAATEAGGPADLAFRRLGLDARELANLDPTEAFARISAGFGAIPTEAEKARLAVDVFGKSGQSLLNTLNAGPADLARLADEFKAFGGSVSEVQRQQVGAMFDSLDRAGAAVEGVGTQIAVGLAPFVQAAAEEFVGLATGGEGMASRVGKGIEYVAKGIGLVADGAQWVKIGFLGLQAAGAEWSLALVSAAESVGKAIEGIVNLIPGMHVEFTSGLTTLREEAEEQARKAGAAIEEALGEEAWSKKVEAGFRRITERSKEMAQAVAKSGGEAKKAADSFQTISDKASEAASKGAVRSFAADAHAIWESARSPLDKYEEQVEKIRRSLKGGAIDEGTAAEAMKNAKKELNGSLGLDLTPWEKYREKLKDIREARDGGALNDKEAALAIGHAGKELGDLHKSRFAGALEVGSSEYRSAVLAATSGRAEGFQAVEKNTATSARANQEMVGLMRQFIQAAGSAPVAFEMR